MNAFSNAEAAACDHLIKMALEEDLGSTGDLTCQAVIPLGHQGRAVFVARSPGVLAGVETVERIGEAVNSGLVGERLLGDGVVLNRGSQIATLEGPMANILLAERMALNFLQHLSGIATLTRRFVDAVAGLPVKILDTRKTIPGWRILAKYAVRCGGGHNHRMGLYDGILIKDNHLASLGAQRKDLASFGVIGQVIAAVREKYGGAITIEIEVETPDQLTAALAHKPTIILLDNMNPDQLREAVLRRNELAPEILLEASGGVNLDTVRAIAETGVDRISIGALTHSAPALDIALDYLQ